MIDLRYKDESFQVMWAAWKCTCHDEEYTTGECDQSVLNQVAAQYRERHNLAADYPLDISPGKIDHL